MYFLFLNIFKRQWTIQSKNNDNMLVWCIYKLCRRENHDNNSTEKGSNKVRYTCIIQKLLYHMEIGMILIQGKFKMYIFNPNKIKRQ